MSPMQGGTRGGSAHSRTSLPSPPRPHGLESCHDPGAHRFPLPAPFQPHPTEISVLNTRLWLLAGYLSVLAFLSLNPWLRPSSAPAPGGIPWDLIDHAIAYAGLAVLAILCLRGRVRGWALPVLALLLSASLGFFIEFCQSWFTSSRNFSYSDAYANGCGALLGVIAFWGAQALAGMGIQPWTWLLSRD